KGLLPDIYMFTLIWTDELGQSTVSEFVIEVVADSDAPLGSVFSGGKLIRPIPSTALLGFLLLGISCLLATGYQHTHKTKSHYSLRTRTNPVSYATSASDIRSHTPNLVVRNQTHPSFSFFVWKWLWWCKPWD
ncbi:MAG: hypothetical protein LBJ43_01930, partial [Propionibacteriaceae bacterium]|nr:hypothetical protein [Propionibacteriaceae bacterium]